MSGLRRRHWRGREGGAARGAVRSLRGGHGGRKGRGFRRKWAGRRVECGFIRAEGAGLKAEVGGGKEAGFGLEWGEWAGLKAEVEGKERGRGLYRKLDGLNGSSSDQSRKCWDLGMNGH